MSELTREEVAELENDLASLEVKAKLLETRLRVHAGNIDQRSVAIGMTNLQTGFLWIQNALSAYPTTKESK